MVATFDVRARAWLGAAVVLAAVVLAGCGDDEPADTTPAGADGLAEELVVPADGVDLRGTLRLPDGDPPHPAVVIVHGSGPHSRDGLAPGQLGLTLPRPVAVYRELAEGLRDRGYAVATWDKRTCGPFNGCADNGYPRPPDDLAFEALQADTSAVLDLLAARDDIGDLAVVGHSKGGTIAAGVLAERPDLAAAVLLASPATPIDEVLQTQAETLARLIAAAGQQGTPAAEEALDEARLMAEEVAAIGGGEVEGPDVGGAPRAFWASWIEASRAAPGRVAASPAPALALGGERDWNVLPDQVLAWEPHLPEGGRVEIMPDITHALTALTTEDPSAITAEDVGTEVDPSVIDTIATWLAEALGRSGR